MGAVREASREFRHGHGCGQESGGSEQKCTTQPKSKSFCRLRLWEIWDVVLKKKLRIPFAFEKKGSRFDSVCLALRDRIFGSTCLKCPCRTLIQTELFLKPKVPGSIESKLLNRSPLCQQLTNRNGPSKPYVEKGGVGPACRNPDFQFLHRLTNSGTASSTLPLVWCTGGKFQ